MSKPAITAAIKAAKKKQWTTDDLNIWNQPGDKAKQLGELEAGKKVLVTGREMWGRTEIVLKGESRWVTDGYLSDDKPIGVGAGLSMEPCPDGERRERTHRQRRLRLPLGLQRVPRDHVVRRLEQPRRARPAAARSTS